MGRVNGNGNGNGSHRAVLTDRQLRFAEEYSIDFNAAQAAIRAGYQPRRAVEVACRLLRHADIRDAIRRQAQAVTARAAIEVDNVLEELAALGFSDIRDVLRWDADGVVQLRPGAEIADHAARAIKSITITTPGKDGGGQRITVTLHDKPRALDKLGQYLGMWEGSPEERGRITPQSLRELLLRLTDEGLNALLSDLKAARAGQAAAGDAGADAARPGRALARR